MPRVLLTTGCTHWPYARQTPQRLGVWEDFEFVIDQQDVDVAVTVLELEGGSVANRLNHLVHEILGRDVVHHTPHPVLENARLKGAGINTMRPWRDALTAYLEAKGLLAG